MFSSKIAILALAMLPAAVISQTASPAAKQPQPLTIPVSHMTDQPLGLKLTSMKLESFQYTSMLTANYDLPKDSDVSDLTEVEFQLIVHQDGHVISGEGWTDTPTGSTLHHTKLTIELGQKAILVIKSVKARSRTLRLNDKDLADHVKDIIQGNAEQERRPQVEVSILDTKPKVQLAFFSTDCHDAANQAAGLCAKGGGSISSFSCNPNSGFSFTCVYKGANRPSQPKSPPGPTVY